MNLMKKTLLIILGILILGMSLAAFFVDRDALIASVGIENAYAVLFVVSATAGVSVFTAAGFFAFFGAFVGANVDPLIASIVAGVGITFGDVIIFLFARLARENSETIKKSKIYQRLCAFVERLPEWGVYTFTLLYAAFIPIPNDILMVVLGVLRYKLLPIIAVMILGNIVLMYLIAQGSIAVL